MGFHLANFGLPRPFRSRVRSRHATDIRTFYNASFHTGRGNNNEVSAVCDGRQEK